MKSEIKHENAVTVIAVSESVDAHTAAELTHTIHDQIASGRARLVIDMRGVDFMSSAGLRALLGAVKETRAAGGDARIVSTNPGVDKVLTMSGFQNIARVFTSEAEATASFGE